MPAGIAAGFRSSSENLSGKFFLVTWWRSEVYWCFNFMPTEFEIIKIFEYFSRRIDRVGWELLNRNKTPRISRCSCNQRIIKINLLSKQFNISKYICKIAHQSPKYSSDLIYFNFPCLVFLRRASIRGWRQLICLSLLSAMGQYPLQFVLCCWTLKKEFFNFLTHTKDRQSSSYQF